MAFSCHLLLIELPFDSQIHIEVTQERMGDPWKQKDYFNITSFRFQESPFVLVSCVYKTKTARRLHLYEKS